MVVPKLICMALGLAWSAVWPGAAGPGRHACQLVEPVSWWSNHTVHRAVACAREYAALAQEGDVARAPWHRCDGAAPRGARQVVERARAARGQRGAARGRRRHGQEAGAAPRAHGRRPRAAQAGPARILLLGWHEDGPKESCEDVWHLAERRAALRRSDQSARRGLSRGGDRGCRVEEEWREAPRHDARSGHRDADRPDDQQVLPRRLSSRRPRRLSSRGRDSASAGQQAVERRYSGLRAELAEGLQGAPRQARARPAQAQVLGSRSEARGGRDAGGTRLALRPAARFLAGLQAHAREEPGRARRVDVVGRDPRAVQVQRRRGGEARRVVGARAGRARASPLSPSLPSIPPSRTRAAHRARLDRSTRTRPRRAARCWRTTPTSRAS